ncbi:MAG: alpha amylase C-terminal domain-containing protein [Lentisphaeria bacterium]|nr:alpha amylase C-terminal domain-containing protein [Lentisphaeria bacterium]
MPALSNNPRPLLDDSYLAPYAVTLARRREHVRKTRQRLTCDATDLAEFANGHEFFGLHHDAEGWIFREWAPNAIQIALVGEPTDWEERDGFRMTRREHGIWELRLPHDALWHQALYRLRIHWNGGAGDRIPAYARRVVQDNHTILYNAQVWVPDTPYCWRNSPPPRSDTPLIYEAHTGMAQEREGIGTYEELRQNMLPGLACSGYNTLQLMAVLEHPYYACFGYHVSNYFAASSRFGTPEELKALVDDAHGLGIRVILDLVHSHAARNETEGLSRFDGTLCQYFHEGARGEHEAWDSRCFDYAKPEVLHFLLSNCRFWLDEYHIDGFRFDGVTSMLYRHHGLGHAFTGYDDYFGDAVDEDAFAYLALANELVHTVRPDAVTIAEDVSGMPGLGAPIEQGGCGFDYRMAMGVTDHVFKMLDKKDEDWSMSALWHEFTNRRQDERTISYVECHDQALVGGQTLAFRLMGDAIYHGMHTDAADLAVDRGLALHKMFRLAALFTAGHGYLNFMGNEFGHPDWIDFPREGNQQSYAYARRQWSLRDNPELRYQFLDRFDRCMLELARRTNAIASAPPQLLALDEQAKILVFERNSLYLLLNLHPTESRSDYEVSSLAGTYQLQLDTDAREFGGHGRVQPGQRHSAERFVVGNTEQHRFRIYLPCRTALVLQRVVTETMKDRRL